jgi:hypothetical protein
MKEAVKEAKAVLSRNLITQEQVWRVKLTGTRPIMFDRYAGNNDTKLEWHQKVYLIPGTRILSVPSLNIMSFFSAHNTNSAPKRLRDKRKYKDIANALLAFLNIDEEFIPLLRDGEAIEMGEPGDREDVKSRLYRRQDVARLDKGIPNPKDRAVLPLPWELEFTMRLAKNSEIQEQEVRNLLVDGGRAIGLGTFRGVFGKFTVEIE